MMKFIKSALITIACMACAVAQAQTTEKWGVTKTAAGIQIASVTNAAGHAAGLICDVDAEGCFPFLNPHVTCKEGVKTPLMINSAVGAYAVVGTCTKFSESTNLLLIDEFDDAINAFQSGGEIGFAMPMESGHFQVVRFNTAGAVAALNEARTLPTPAQRKKTRAVEML